MCIRSEMCICTSDGSGERGGGDKEVDIGEESVSLRAEGHCGEGKNEECELTANRAAMVAFGRRKYLNDAIEYLEVYIWLNWPFQERDKNGDAH